MPSRTEGATPFFHSRLIAQLCVIILVLLEYGLRLAKACLKGFIRGVLILILLEYGLRRTVLRTTPTFVAVLILILLEYGLRRQNEDTSKFAAYFVLILILLEYGLRQNYDY